MNADDDIRDAILRFLYDRHKQSKGITKIPIGIRDLSAALRKSHGFKQNEVASNLDYLIQVGWVREVVKERSFKTARGMELSQEQIRYKISDVGINHLQAGTIFKPAEAAASVNITNVRGVTIVGDGNVVNTQYTELSRALDEFDKAIAASHELRDDDKVDAAGDLATIRTQISKPNPDKSIITAAWKSLERVATVGTLAELSYKVGEIINQLLT